MKLAEESGIRYALAAQNAATMEPSADQVHLAMDLSSDNAPAAAAAAAAAAGSYSAARPGAMTTNMEELLDVLTGVDVTAEPPQIKIRQARAPAQASPAQNLLPFITPILREFGITEVDMAALEVVHFAAQARIASMATKALAVARRRKEEHLLAHDSQRNVAHSREALAPQFGLPDANPSAEQRIVEKQDVVLALACDSTPKSETLLSRLARN
jgi:hypothetical protein